MQEPESTTPPVKARDLPMLSIGSLMAGIGILPFLAGHLLFSMPASGSFLQETAGGESLCLFRQAFGIPCPACGGTRAFVAFTHGNKEFVYYNWYWLPVLALTAGFGVYLIYLALTRKQTPAWLEKLKHLTEYKPYLILLAVLLLVLLPAWAVGFTNAEYILN